MEIDGHQLWIVPRVNFFSLLDLQNGEFKILMSKKNLKIIIRYAKCFNKN